MSPEKMVERAKRCVCKICGSELKIELIIYNKYGGQAYELFCPQCQRIEYGTEKEIYNLAKNFVENVEFDYFIEMEEGKRKFELNVAKICEVLSWTLRELKLVDGHGIKINTICDLEYPKE